MKIQAVRVSESAAVAVLFDQYRQFYKQSPDIQAAQVFLTERLKNRQSIIFAVRIEDQIVGFVQLYPSFSSIRMKSVLILNDLYVLPEARGRGIGAALIQTSVQYAKEKGCHHMILCTAKDNPAQALYKKLGWKFNQDFDYYSFNL